MPEPSSNDVWTNFGGATPRSIVWIEIANCASYVQATVAVEAADIPMALYANAAWHQTSLALRAIDVDRAMLTAHDHDPLHQQRALAWCRHILQGRPLLPLIVLACDRGPAYLVDGYARYRALRHLGVEHAQVLRQSADA